MMIQTNSQRPISAHQQITPTPEKNNLQPPKRKIKYLVEYLVTYFAIIIISSGLLFISASFYVAAVGYILILFPIMIIIDSIVIIELTQRFIDCNIKEAEGKKLDWYFLAKFFVIGFLFFGIIFTIQKLTGLVGALLFVMFFLNPIFTFPFMLSGAFIMILEPCVGISRVKLNRGDNRSEHLFLIIFVAVIAGLAGLYALSTIGRG